LWFFGWERFPLAVLDRGERLSDACVDAGLNFLDWRFLSVNRLLAAALASDWLHWLLF
jgi:hypothetical protein